MCYSTLRFNGHFPGGPGLDSTRMSPFWILLELRMTQAVVTTEATRRAKLQSNCHQQQNIDGIRGNFSCNHKPSSILLSGRKGRHPACKKYHTRNSHRLFSRPVGKLAFLSDHHHHLGICIASITEKRT